MVPAVPREDSEWYQMIEQYRERTVPVVPAVVKGRVVPDTMVPVVPRARKVGTN